MSPGEVIEQPAQNNAPFAPPSHDLPPATADNIVAAPMYTATDPTPSYQENEEIGRTNNHENEEAAAPMLHEEKLGDLLYDLTEVQTHFYGACEEIEQLDRHIRQSRLDAHFSSCSSSLNREKTEARGQE